MASNNSVNTGIRNEIPPPPNLRGNLTVAIVHMAPKTNSKKPELTKNESPEAPPANQPPEATPEELSTSNSTRPCGGTPNTDTVVSSTKPHDVGRQPPSCAKAKDRKLITNTKMTERSATMQPEQNSIVATMKGRQHQWNEDSTTAPSKRTTHRGRGNCRYERRPQRNCVNSLNPNTPGKNPFRLDDPMNNVVQQISQWFQSVLGMEPSQAISYAALSVDEFTLTSIQEVEFQFLPREEQLGSTATPTDDDLAPWTTISPRRNRGKHRYRKKEDKKEVSDAPESNKFTLLLAQARGTSQTPITNQPPHLKPAPDSRVLSQSLTGSHLLDASLKQLESRECTTGSKFTHEPPPDRHRKYSRQPMVTPTPEDTCATTRNKNNGINTMDCRVPQKETVTYDEQLEKDALTCTESHSFLHGGQPQIQPKVLNSLPQRCKHILGIATTLCQDEQDYHSGCDCHEAPKADSHPIPNGLLPPAMG